MNSAAPGSFVLEGPGAAGWPGGARDDWAPADTGAALGGFDGAWHLDRNSAVAPEMACLLANMLRHLPSQGGAPITVHMLACGAVPSINHVAYGLARASAAGLGRTLLAGSFSGAAASARAAGRTRIGSVIPDVAVDRLFHFDSGTDATGGLALARGCEPALLAVEPFRMVILMESAAAAGTALAAASFCIATILVVQAGVTKQAEVRQAVRAVARAGGHVLGTILATPP